MSVHVVVLKQNCGVRFNGKFNNEVIYLSIFLFYFSHSLTLALSLPLAYSLCVSLSIFMDAYSFTCFRQLTEVKPTAYTITIFFRTTNFRRP